MAALTEEQRELILELAEDEELTKAEIARRTGVSRPTVYKVLREAGLLQSVSDEEDEEETYAEGDEAPDAVEGDEEDDEEDYAELTEEEERRVLELYGRRRVEVGERVADELGLDRETVLEAIEADGTPQEVPAKIVLGSPTSALVGLVGGLILGAWGLYYAKLRCLTGPPGGHQE
ncbi:MAG: helix-turn-helix domain-containing protein [Actinomycetota bacterium]|nr:helix-turn-helix domain-containing protein [Actinomycetota bacterium]